MRAEFLKVCLMKTRMTLDLATTMFIGAVGLSEQSTIIPLSSARWAGGMVTDTPLGFGKNRLLHAFHPKWSHQLFAELGGIQLRSVHYAVLSKSS